MKYLRLGFVPLIDCAPLVMAQELGLFAKYGLSVHLSREIGWATIRDKIIYGELDAAQALAAMPFAATFGLGSVECECVTGLVLNLNGNGITLSKDLWACGVRDAGTLRPHIDHHRGRRILTFGVVFPFSSHNYLLRKWLADGGIDPDNDVRIVVVPAPLMFENLKSGHLDGYCVGEPWNTVAVRAGIGWCAATSLKLAPFHPEKVLMVRRHFAEENERQHRGLIAAILEACAFCDSPENRDQIVRTLASPGFVNVGVEALRGSLQDCFDLGNGRVESLPDFHVFSRQEANEPTSEKAAWILRHLFAGVTVKNRPVNKSESSAHVFRSDLFQEARQLMINARVNDGITSNAEVSVAA